MRTSPLSLFVCAALAVTACGDDAPTGPADAATGYPDITMVPIDGATRDVSTGSDVVDERGSTCRNGAYRPCECAPGELGRDYCIGTTFENRCRCGDAGPPVIDAAVDVGSDAAPDVDPKDPLMDASAGNG